MAAGAVAFIGQFTAWTYITPFLMEHTHLSSGEISLLYVIYGCGGIVGSLGAGSLFKRRVIGRSWGPSWRTLMAALSCTASILRLAWTFPCGSPRAGGAPSQTCSRKSMMPSAGSKRGSSMI